MAVAAEGPAGELEIGDPHRSAYVEGAAGHAAAVGAVAIAGRTDFTGNGVADRAAQAATGDGHAQAVPLSRTVVCSRVQGISRLPCQVRPAGCRREVLRRSAGR